MAIRFRPDAGDRYRLRSEIETEVTRTIEDETDVDRSRSRLRATEEVVDVDRDEVQVEVTVARDGAAPRTYETRFGRTGRLSTIDLVEGVPTEALGLDLATGLPPEIMSPPAARLEPGATWTVERRVVWDDDGEPVTVRGTGRLASLGVEDGREVAVAVVEVSVPVRSVVETADGTVTLAGVQRSRSETAYDLADGTARRDRTVIDGDLDVIVEPPRGVDAPPVRGAVRYEVHSTTTRRAIADARS